MYLTWNRHLIIGNIYRPPSNNKNITDSALEIHYSILNQIKNTPHLRKAKIFLVGDFNLDLIQGGSNSNIGDYIDTMFNFGLFPCVTKPTRFDNKIARTAASPTSLLDHIFCSSFSPKFAGILIDDLSDHLLVVFIDQLKTPRYKN